MVRAITEMRQITVASALASARIDLRSSSEIRLVIPRQSNKYDERAFAVATQLTWNRLPSPYANHNPSPYIGNGRKHLFEFAYWREIVDFCIVCKAP